MPDVRVMSRLAGAVLTAAALSACAPPGLDVAGDVAASGLSAYRELRYGSTPAVETRFADTAITARDRTALAAVDGVAVWPAADNASVGLAERLGEKGLAIVTPSVVTQWAARQDLPADTAAYTTGDWQGVLSALCRDHQTDGVLVLREAGSRTVDPGLTLAPPRQERDVEVFLHGCAAGRVIWRDTLTLSMDTANPPAATDTAAAAATAIADRLLTLTASDDTGEPASPS